MSTVDTTFDQLKSVVQRLQSLEEHLAHFLSNLSSVKLEARDLLQEICPHTSTRQWLDFSDHHRTKHAETCLDCGEELK
jgi:regulator of replication initiation timing